MQDIDTYSVLGFSGSRSGSAAAAAFLGGLEFSGRVVVGCAAGVDALVRAQFPEAFVLEASRWGVGAWALAARSAALVRALVPGGLLVAFPVVGCPVGVRVSRSFRGFGSGTWGTVALAIGLGVPVRVFVPAGLSVGALPLVAGPEVELGGVSGSWWSWSPPVRQLSLF